jgi:hypothetical protein
MDIVGPSEVQAPHYMAGGLRDRERHDSSGRRGGGESLWNYFSTVSETSLVCDDPEFCYLPKLFTILN